MREPSKGISPMLAISGSFCIFSHEASAVARSGHSIQLNTTVSSSVA